MVKFYFIILMLSQSALAQKKTSDDFIAALSGATSRIYLKMQAVEDNDIVHILGLHHYKGLDVAMILPAMGLEPKMIKDFGFSVYYTSRSSQGRYLMALIDQNKWIRQVDGSFLVEPESNLSEWAALMPRLPASSSAGATVNIQNPVEFFGGKDDFVKSYNYSSAQPAGTDQPEIKNYTLPKVPKWKLAPNP